MPIATRLSDRDGPASLAGGDEYVHRDDLNQLAKARIALAEVISELSGGPGLYAGGAADETELGGSGTTYPAFTAWIADRDDVRWPVITTAFKAIVFSATSGSIKLWAIPNTQSGVTPPAAIGGPADVLLVCQAASDPDPDDGLLLGTGTATAGAITSFTGEALVQLTADQVVNTPAGNIAATTVQGALNELDSEKAALAGATFTGAVDIEGALTLLDGGSDHDITIARADVAAARTYTIPEVGAAADFVMTAGAQTVAGVKTFSSTPVVPNDSFTYAKLQNVSDTDKLLGRSTAGAGDIEEIPCTAAARSILDDATVSAIIATLFGTYVAETDYFSSSTIVGWAASPTGVIYYSRLGNVVTVNFYITGTSDNTASSFTLPYQLKTGISVLSAAIRVIDNGSSQADAGNCYMSSGSALVTITKTLTGTGFTASGTKTVSGQFRYFCNA